jgi:hypothetical protein
MLFFFYMLTLLDINVPVINDHFSLELFEGFLHFFLTFELDICKPFRPLILLDYSDLRDGLGEVLKSSLYFGLRDREGQVVQE